MSAAITSLILALASPSSRLSLRSTHSGGLAALTTTSVERADGSYVMAGVNSFLCRFGMRRRTTSPGGRLMDLHTAAAYLGCSYWTLRDLVLGGHIPAVRIPSPRARDGRVMRRILIDSRDLDRLIERWKEVDSPEANPT